MNKKIILITGASDGVGKETAKTLAKLGHTIIMHGRNMEKTESAYQEIKAVSGNNNIEMYIADFLSLAEVKTFANKIIKKYKHIDVLINNAGAQFTDIRETTSEGHEKTMVINVFAPMLLTMLLLDLLKNSKSARVVTVSSSAHKMTGKPDLTDIELRNGYTLTKAYGLSKLYIIWIMQNFVDEMKMSGVNNVTYNCVHPSSTVSSLGRESGKSLKWKIVFFLWKPLMVSIEKAASSSIKAAVAPEMEGVTGRYFGPKGEETPSQKYYSRDNQVIVWDYSMDVIRPYIS